MKKTSILTLIFLVTISFSFYNFSENNISLKNSETENVKTDFCKGWDDGFQEAMDDCLYVAVTPVCPVCVSCTDYKTGFGKGYAKGVAYVKKKTGRDCSL